jgi:hypothetical protein
MSSLTTPAQTLLPLTLTLHARMRMEERSISRAEVEATLTYGSTRRSAGVRVHEFDEAARLRARRCGLELEGSVGLRVITDLTGWVITVYRTAELGSPTCAATATPCGHSQQNH